MMASLQGSVGTGTEEDVSSTGRFWAAGFHHVTAYSLLARVLKLINIYFFHFPNFFSGRGQPRITETADTGVHLYIHFTCVFVVLYSHFDPLLNATVSSGAIANNAKR
jgi:hypothetical protein